MKKKTIKDEEGYLGKSTSSLLLRMRKVIDTKYQVTKEEPAWESFSEDDPAPSLAKKSGPASSAASSKVKQEAKKPGQGNITSFFGKR